METSRRSFITGLVSFIAAPAIVRAGSLMPVKAIPPEYESFTSYFGWDRDYVAHDWRHVSCVSTIDITEVYGRAPSMQMTQDLKEIHARLNRVLIDNLLSVQRSAEHFPPEQQ